jgi:ribosomal protein S1
VEAVVASHTAKGLLLNWGGLTLAAHQSHLAQHASLQTAAAVHPVGSRTQARILYVDESEKQLRVSLQARHVQLQPCVVAAHIGQTVPQCVVRRVDPEGGCLVQLNETSSPSDAEAPVFGYVHISRLADDHVEKIGKRYAEGTTHAGRVVGLNLMDGLAALSFEASVLSRRYLQAIVSARPIGGCPPCPRMYLAAQPTTVACYACLRFPFFQDVPAGALVTGEVVRLTDNGLVMQLAENITGSACMPPL